MQRNFPIPQNKSAHPLLEKDLTDKIIGAAIEVHRILGPGLCESAYQVCMERESKLREVPFEHLELAFYPQSLRHLPRAQVPGRTRISSGVSRKFVSLRHGSPFVRRIASLMPRAAAARGLPSKPCETAVQAFVEDFLVSDNVFYEKIIVRYD